MRSTGTCGRAGRRTLNVTGIELCGRHRRWHRAGTPNPERRARCVGEIPGIRQSPCTRVMPNAGLLGRLRAWQSSAQITVAPLPTVGSPPGRRHSCESARHSPGKPPPIQYKLASILPAWSAHSFKHCQMYRMALHPHTVGPLTGLAIARLSFRGALLASTLV